MIYVLDTHALVWAIENDPRLSAAAKAVMTNPTAEFVIPTVGGNSISHGQEAIFSEPRSGLPAIRLLN